MELLAILSRMLRLAGPLLLAGCAAVLAGKAGVVPWGLEGLVTLSACLTAWVWQGTQNLLLVILTGMGTGAALAAVSGLFILRFRANGVLVGFAITLLGIGLAFLLGSAFDSSASDVEILSEGASLGQVLGGSAFFGAGLACAVILVFLLYATRAGLRLRAVAGFPAALASRGVRMAGLRWTCLLAGGILAGLAGIAVSMGTAGLAWRDAVGIGFAALLAAQVGRYTPQGMLMAVLALSGAQAWAAQDQETGANALRQSLPWIVALVALILSGVRREKMTFEEPVSTVSGDVDKMWTKKRQP